MRIDCSTFGRQEANFFEKLEQWNCRDFSTAGISALQGFQHRRDSTQFNGSL